MANESVVIRNLVPSLISGLSKRLEREIAKAFENIGEKGVALIKERFDIEDANASKLTRDSIEAKIQKRQIVFQSSGDRAQVMRFVENGRGPGRFPPPQIILEWMDDRGI